MAGSVASMWLDGLVSGLGLVSLSASFAFPGSRRGPPVAPAAIVTNFIYPVVDLALLAIAVGAIAALGAWRERTWLLLGAGSSSSPPRIRPTSCSWPQHLPPRQRG